MILPKFLDVQWEYEDQLPELPDSRYSLMFRQSKIIDGVRMFPYVQIRDEKYYLQ